MVRITTTMTTTKSTTLSKPPSTICGGFIDTDGIWNNGFPCPLQNLVQFFCCDTDNYHHCCPPERYLPEVDSRNDQIYISGQYQPSNHNIIDATRSNLLMKNSDMINKQFVQFQKLFLPIFLLTTSILFLVGIAIWFWLYKHKAFYAMGRDDLNEQNQVVSRISHTTHADGPTKKRESIYLTMERQSRRLSHPSTEV